MSGLKRLRVSARHCDGPVGLHRGAPSLICPIGRLLSALVGLEEATMRQAASDYLHNHSRRMVTLAASTEETDAEGAPVFAGENLFAVGDEEEVHEGEPESGDEVDESVRSFGVLLTLLATWRPGNCCTPIATFLEVAIQTTGNVDDEEQEKEDANLTDERRRT